MAVHNITTTPASKLRFPHYTLIDRHKGLINVVALEKIEVGDTLEETQGSGSRQFKVLEIVKKGWAKGQFADGVKPVSLLIKYS
jgi:sRNA-binding protein